MNSEELELSLRTEFESYLKGFLADLKQEVSEFQKNFETEFEKHKSQTDEAIRKLQDRFDKGVDFDQAFNESVVEHLRLARDEGATITAVAIGEAEKMKEEAAPVAEFDKIRDAITEISSKTTQSEILKSLVEHASAFAPRGVFFIVKNDHFVGWRPFGEEAGLDEATVQNVQFPMSEDTVLAVAINSLVTTTAGVGSHRNDSLFLDPLNFGTPDRMYAIPLVARGRGVAVLYADFGSGGVLLNAEALETLVRVAGLTVELAAAGVQPAPAPRPVERIEASPNPQHHFETEVPVTVVEDGPSDSFAEDRPYEVSEVDEQPAPADFQHVEEVGRYEPVDESQATEFDEGPVHEVTAEVVRDENFGNPGQEGVTYFEPVEEPAVSEPSFAQPAEVHEYAPASEQEEFPDVIDEPVSRPVEAAPLAENLAEVGSSHAARSRYRDRNVDLPIEVPEEERRLHNDARRFARLLVSEIKLYNEQKVTDGRASGDLYDRLREAIDRSRDMCTTKRVQQPVADKFDYFHYELVSSLAEGDDVKLGASYPGSKVPA